MAGSWDKGGKENDPTSGRGPLPQFVEGKGAGKQKRGDQFQGEGSLLWREHLTQSQKAGLRSPAAPAGWPQGHSPAVAPSVLICKMRASRLPSL